MIEHGIKEGMSIFFDKEVDSSDTAAAYGSKALDFLLSSPALVGMLINASAELLDPLVPQECVTVGNSVELYHEKPTLLGENVRLVVTVKTVAGDKISLEFIAYDKVGVIARGKHERFVVLGEDVLDSAYERLGLGQLNHESGTIL
jgi:fluoroacetyl-CoA thioesterase